MELLGKIKVIGEVKTYGEKGFRKRELVLTTEEQYPQPVSYTHLTLPTTPYV